MGIDLNEDAIFEQLAQYQGPADYKDLYSLLWGFFDSKGFSIKELKYASYKKGAAEDILIDWECNKKSSSYVSFKIKVAFQFFGISQIEVLQNGVKATVPQGVFKVKVSGLILSGGGAWSKNGFLKFLRRVYDKYFFGRRVDIWTGKTKGKPTYGAFGEYKFQIGKVSGICAGAVDEAKSFFGIYKM